MGEFSPGSCVHATSSSVKTTNALALLCCGRPIVQCFTAVRKCIDPVGLHSPPDRARGSRVIRHNCGPRGTRATPDRARHSIGRELETWFTAPLPIRVSEVFHKLNCFVLHGLSRGFILRSPLQILYSLADCFILHHFFKAREILSYLLGRVLAKQ